MNEREIEMRERRAHQRYRVRLATEAKGARGKIVCETEDISVGGACVAVDEKAPVAVGERMRLRLAVPGTRKHVDLEGEVRWLKTAGRRRLAGISFGQSAQVVMGALIAGFVALSGDMVSAESTIPTFDPSSPVDLNKYDGPERPDEFTLMQAFQNQFDDFDRCIEAIKGKSGTQLEGDAKMEVLLNPAGKRPLGINAHLPSSIKKQGALKECLRKATAGAPYPSYDGPPVVVNFEFELDPGETWE
jgi:hypothetical protein